MTRARGHRPGSTPANPWITILEFMATERPEQLEAVLSVAEDSPARVALLQLANLTALLHFAIERHERVTGGRRRRRLRYVRGRLEAGLEHARRRKQIGRILRVPASPSAAAADPRWLQEFIGR